MFRGHVYRPLNVHDTHTTFLPAGLALKLLCRPEVTPILSFPFAESQQTAVDKKQRNIVSL